MVSSKNIFKNKSVNKKEIFLKFLFLQHPIKIRRHIVYILILASMIALSLILSYISIPIPAVGIKISFTWLPTIVIGWFFGPIVGFIMGSVIDTIGFLFHGGIWFWLYAIQEPMVGFITGLISFSNYLISKTKNHNRNSFIFIQIILNLFVFFVFLFLLLMFVKKFDLLNIKQGTNISTNVLIAILFTLIFIFYIIIETIIIIQYRQKKTSMFFFIVSVCCIITMIFSFILGPISAVEYLKYVNNKTPNTFIKYGYLAYLIPRVIKELFKTPIYIFLLWSIVISINSVIRKINNQILNTWKV